MKENRFIHQSDAISYLSHLLHLKRQKIASLVARKRHPLPLPPRAQESNCFHIDDRYLRQLRRWVLEEKSVVEAQRTSLNLDEAAHELTSTTCPDHAKETWSIEEDLNHLPPGEFLG